MTEDDINWSDWIEHKGGGCPLPVGTMVCREFDDAVDMIDSNPVEEMHRHTGPVVEEEWQSWLGVRMLLRIAENPTEKADHNAG